MRFEKESGSHIRVFTFKRTRSYRLRIVMRIPAAGYVCRLFAETHCDFELKRVERFDVGKLLFPYCGHLPPLYLFAPDSTRRTRSKINPFTSTIYVKSQIAQLPFRRHKEADWWWSLCSPDVRRQHIGRQCSGIQISSSLIGQIAAGRTRDHRACKTGSPPKVMTSGSPSGWVRVGIFCPLLLKCSPFSCGVE